jgi:hypothetical protein
MKATTSVSSDPVAAEFSSAFRDAQVVFHDARVVIDAAAAPAMSHRSSSLRQRYC